MLHLVNSTENEKFPKHDKFPNLYCRTEQTEIYDFEYPELISKLATMLGIGKRLTNVEVKPVSADARKLVVTFNKQLHTFQGDFPAKYLAWEVIAKVTQFLEGKAVDIRLAVLFSDMQFSIAALTPGQFVAINRELDDENGFQWIAQ